MSKYFTEHSSETEVNARVSSVAGERLKEVMESLVVHLHAFAKDIHLSVDEWNVAIDFLTKTGQVCSSERQEFILLSDTLGLSMLVDAINNRRPAGATENTVLGPFHVDDAPIRQMGDNISLDGVGQSCLFEGRVIDVLGNPIKGAMIDVWSDNGDGYYDIQQPDLQPKWNNRGRFITGDDGGYRFRGIKPVSYPIPNDGPVGQMLEKLGRHPFRPAHMHFIVTAPEFEKIITHTFISDDPYINDDTVFGVKESLIAKYEYLGGATDWECSYEFVMVPKEH